MQPVAVRGAFFKMSRKIIPYKYDLFAGICTVLVVVAGNLFERGNSSLLKLTGLLLLMSSIILWIAPIFALKKYGNVEKGTHYFETHTVVRNGAYALVRHPQYLAYIFLVSGFAFLYQNWIVYTITVLAIALFYLHSIEEEEELLEKYAQNYKDYCKHVPRFNIVKSTFKIFIKMLS